MSLAEVLPVYLTPFRQGGVALSHWTGGRVVAAHREKPS